VHYILVKNIKTAFTFLVTICLIVVEYGPKYVGNEPFYYQLMHIMLKKHRVIKTF